MSGMSHTQEEIPLFIVALRPNAGVFDEGPDFLGFPNGSARAEFDGLGEAACAAAFPPCAFADGDDCKDLGQAEKADRGNRRLLL